MLKQAQKLSKRFFTRRAQFSSFTSNYDQKLNNDIPLKNILPNQQQIMNQYYQNFKWIINAQENAENLENSLKQKLGDNYSQYKNNSFQAQITTFKSNQIRQNKMNGRDQIMNSRQDFYSQSDAQKVIDNTTLQNLALKNENGDLSYMNDVSLHESHILSLGTKYDYQLQENECLLFNIPAHFTQDQIMNKIKEFQFNIDSIKNSELQRCLMGLPGNMKFTFDNQNSAEQFYSMFEQKQWDENILQVRLDSTIDYENIKNRTLVITNLNQNWSEQEILEILSDKFRITNLEIQKVVCRPQQQENDQFSHSQKQGLVAEDNDGARYLTDKQIYEKKLEFSKNQSNQFLKQQSENSKQFEYLNKGYCFVTFVSTDQAKLALLMLNKKMVNGSALNLHLKQDYEHFHFDRQFIEEKLKQIQLEINNEQNQVSDPQELRDQMQNLYEQQHISQNDKIEFRYKQYQQFDLNKYGRQQNNGQATESDYDQLKSLLEQSSTHDQKLQHQKKMLELIDQNVYENITKLQSFENDLRRMLIGKYDPLTMKSLIEDGQVQSFENPQYLIELLQQEQAVNLDMLGLRTELDLNGFQSYKMHNGEQYLNEFELKRLQEYILPQDQNLRQQYLKEQQQIREKVDSLPNQFYNQYENFQNNYQDYNKIWAKDLGVPVQSFQLKEGQDAQELVKSLNQESEMGETYRAITNAEGQNFIIKAQTTPVHFDMEKIESLDEQNFLNNLALKEAKSQNISQQEAQSLIQQNLQKLVDEPEYEQLLVEEFDDELIEELMEETGMKRIEIQNILKFDGKLDQAMEQDLSIQQEIKQARQNVKQLQDDDFVKNVKQKWNIQDEQGKFITSKYKPV